MVIEVKKFLHDESGAITIIAAVGMIALVGFVALAIDVGNIALVKGELQRAADAGALAAARALYPYTGNPARPNWSRGTTWATQTVQNNQANGENLADCSITLGYWNLATNTMQSSSITPGTKDVPAATVTVSKTTGKNGGPLQLFLAPILGYNSSDISAQATAFISLPTGFPPGSGILPFVVNKDLVDRHWNDDPPFDFTIGSTYHYDEGDSGQWTSLKQDINSDSYVKDLINNGNPEQVNVGDNIWIQPGTKTNLFGEVQSVRAGQTVMLPVVRTDFDTHAMTPILAFVAFHVTHSEGGNVKGVMGYMVDEHLIPNANPGGGTYYGSIVAPKLAN